MLGLRAAAVAVALVSVAACVPRYVVPEQLEPQVDRSVGFSQLRLDAARHAGASVVLGGSVLEARLTPEGTQIEVLQLPLDASDRPSGPPELSEGRFLLIDPQRTDPAALQQRLVTVVGEVLGTRTGKVDEVDYTYPLLSARFIHVWRAYDYPAGAAPPYSYPSYYPYYYPYSYPYPPYYYSPYLYGDPFYWPAPYFYGSYYYYGTGGSSHRDSPPRRFEPPSGGGAPPPSTPPPSPRPPSGGGGGGRKFK